jgi:glucosamine kinase
MKLALGFDGGGTKTHCVLLDQQGRFLAESRGGPSNPTRVGFGGALASICEAARIATQTARASVGDIASLCAGLAGTGLTQAAQKMKNLLAQEFPHALVDVCTDLDLTLAATGDGPTIVLLAGTGSAAVGRDCSGHLERVGGLGPLLSDEGSAYDIGRRAVMTELRKFERNRANSLLGARILRDLSVASWDDLRSRAAASPDEVFPRVFPVVAEAAESGDTSAREILRIAAAELGWLVNDLVERLELRDQKFLLVKSGGMLGRSSYFDGQIDQRLREAAPNAQFGVLAMPPAEAAARMALRLLASPREEGKTHGRT